MLGNLGDTPIDGEGENPVLITDTLPPGLTPVSPVAPPHVNSLEAHGGESKCHAEGQQVHCTFGGVLYPYKQLEVEVKVDVAASPGTLEGQVSVKGGGSSEASSAQRFTVSEQPTPFGAQDFEVGLSGQGGAPATPAGSHPSQMTTTLALNQEPAGAEERPVALPKDLRFALPPGLVGDPEAVQQCPLFDFDAHKFGPDHCQPGSVVGVATATVREPEGLHTITQTAPVFDLVPAYGEPARFGFEVKGLVFVTIDTSLQTGGDYRVVASVERINQTAGLLSSQVTLWGVPGASSHDLSRGWKCLAYGEGEEQVRLKEAAEVEPGEGCPPSSPPGEGETPLLTAPSSCAKDPALEPVLFSLEMDSWSEPGAFLSASPYLWATPLAEPLAFEDCSQLPFTPSLETSPETHSASTPTGLDVSVTLPQQTTLEAEGLAEADVRDTTVTLPEGVQLNPSAANGLQACREQTTELPGGVIAGGVGFQGFQEFQPGAPTALFSTGFDLTVPEHPSLGESFCPEASKLGLVHVRTPLLPKELQGSLYLAEPAPNGEPGKNPFGSLVALYLVAEDKEAGILVKLAGRGELNESTGQLKTSFQSTPQLPFEELKVELFGGQRASISTPAFCGSYAASSVFDAWSGAVAEPSSEPFEVTSGAGGGPCPSGPLAFSPSFLAQSENEQAGAFSPFELEIARPDGQQPLSGLEVRLPPGIAALLSTVTPCPEPPRGQEWACGAESLIGHSTASSGLGSEPVILPGDVYLTSGYDGAPFGLLVRTKAEAGPFDLGYVNVRSRINVNPETAAVTVTTDPGPRDEALITMLKGIPVQLKRIVVSVDRQDFEFNPTNCDPMAITAVLDGSEGARDPVSSPFQVGGCQNLPFSPKLTASVVGQASKEDGAEFAVKVQSPGLGQADIHKVDLTLPAALPSRLSTIQKACLASVFEANPASCDEGSVIGQATVHTPVLKSPLTGPAYLVSHGSAEFPDVEFVLQGEGITLVLDGKTDIKDGITYSKFESAPDAPFTVFETLFPAGPNSALTANVPESEDYNLCRTSLSIPTEITGQNGAFISQATPVEVKGCAGVLPSKTVKTKKLTLAQQLAKALSKCRSTYRHSASRRTACERKARATYKAKALAECRKTDKHSTKKRRACEADARRAYAARNTSRA